MSHNVGLRFGFFGVFFVWLVFFKFLSNLIYFQNLGGKRVNCLTLNSLQTYGIISCGRKLWMSYVPTHCSVLGQLQNMIRLLSAGWEN